MKLPTSLITFLNSLAFSVLALQSNHAHPQPDLFTGLEYDEAQIRETIERFSKRVEAPAGAAEIPSSVSYRIFVQELIADTARGFDIPAVDANILQDLGSASAQELSEKHREALSDLCMRTAHSGNSPTEVIDLAALFDESREESERDLDVRFAEAVDRLSPATAQAVDERWENFSRNRTIVYTTFDMSGFAGEMPEAAHRMMLAGCTRFQNMTRAR